MTYMCRLGDANCSCSGFERSSCHNSRAIECHCGKDGHALNSINCPVHGKIVEIEKLRDFVRWVDTWVSNPAASYSTSALDGMFGMTRDRIAALSDLTKNRKSKPKDSI